MNHKQVTSFEHLLELLAEGKTDFYILLNGNLRSSKTIFQQDEDLTTLTIINEIDDTLQTLTKEQFFNPDFTNAGEALNEGSLYYYNWSN